VKSKRKFHNFTFYYHGNSIDNTQIQDRRRFFHYARLRELRMSNSQESSDIIVVTPTSNLLNVAKQKQGRQRLILDLVDGYLFEKTGILKDYGRSLLRSELKSIPLQTFSGQLRSFIQVCDAIVVASIEQANSIKNLNPNVHVILDCHSELGTLPLDGPYDHTNRSSVLWEGQSSNLSHLIPVISRILASEDVKMLDIVTNQSIYVFGDRYIRRSTRNFLNRQIDKRLSVKLKLIPWSTRSLVEASMRSKFAVIPINESDSFAMAKPENKLLIMWRLGLPAFVSPTPAYTRVLTQLGLDRFIIKENEWGNFSVFRDLCTEWSYHRDLVREFLNLEHSCQALSSKWDLVFESIL